MTEIQISKWGNSSAIRLPKAVLDELGLKPGQSVQLTVKDGKGIIEPVRRKRSRWSGFLPRRIVLGRRTLRTRWSGDQIVATRSSTTNTPDAGDIAWIDLDPVRGTEQSGRRPAIVLTDAGFNARYARSIVCPITSNIDSVADESVASGGTEDTRRRFLPTSREPCIAPSAASASSSARRMRCSPTCAQSSPRCSAYCPEDKKGTGSGGKGAAL